MCARKIEGCVVPWTDFSKRQTGVTLSETSHAYSFLLISTIIAPAFGCIRMNWTRLCWAAALSSGRRGLIVHNVFCHQIILFVCTFR